MMNMMQPGKNKMHGDGSVVAQQHANLAQIDATATTKQQQKQQEYIKKPMNAFIVWSREQRGKVAAEHPTMNSSEISKRLGAEWRTLKNDEKNVFFKVANRLREQHERDHPDYNYRSTRKPKPAMMPAESVMSYPLPNFQRGIDARAFMANPLSYDIVNRSNVVANHMEPYGMYSTTYPASYGPDPQGGDYQRRLSVTPGQYQSMHLHYKLLSSNQYPNVFAQDANNRSEPVHSNENSRSPLLQHSSPEQSQKGMSPPKRQQMLDPSIPTLFNSFKPEMTTVGMSHYSIAYCASPYGAKISSPSVPESSVQGPVKSDAVLENASSPGVQPPSPFMKSMYEIHPEIISSMGFNRAQHHTIYMPVSVLCGRGMLPSQTH